MQHYCYLKETLIQKSLSKISFIIPEKQVLVPEKSSFYKNLSKIAAVLSP